MLHYEYPMTGVDSQQCPPANQEPEVVHVGGPVLPKGLAGGSQAAAAASRSSALSTFGRLYGRIPLALASLFIEFSICNTFIRFTILHIITFRKISLLSNIRSTSGHRPQAHRLQNIYVA